MKIRKRIIHWLLGLTLTALSVTALPVQAGNIHRSCKAWFRVYMSTVANSANNERLLNITQHWSLLGPPHTTYAFSASGGCGAAVPNRCRRRASEAAIKCMRAQVKNPSTVPAACRTNAIHNYHVTQFPKLVKFTACDWMYRHSNINLKILPNPYTVNTNIFAVVVGDKGCGGGNRTMVVKKDLGAMAVSCENRQSAH